MLDMFVRQRGLSIHHVAISAVAPSDRKTNSAHPAACTASKRSSYMSFFNDRTCFSCVLRVPRSATAAAECRKGRLNRGGFYCSVLHFSSFTFIDLYSGVSLPVFLFSFVIISQFTAVTYPFGQNAPGASITIDV